MDPIVVPPVEAVPVPVGEPVPAPAPAPMPEPMPEPMPSDSASAQELVPAGDTFSDLSAIASHNPFFASVGAIIALLAGGMAWRKKRKARKAARNDNA